MTSHFFQNATSDKEKKDRYVIKTKIGYVAIDDEGEFFYTKTPEMILLLEDAKKLNKKLSGTILYYGKY